MNTHKLLPTLGLTALCAAQAVGQPAQRPNVVLMIADDHGKEALGCYGNPVIKTPALDGLAKDGILFDNAFCTSASSSASRSVILTGRFNHSTGHYGHEHNYHHFSTFDTESSLPVYLSKAGYQTVRIGKYHVAPEKVYHFDKTLESAGRNDVQLAENCRQWMQEAAKGDQPFFLYFCTDDPHRDSKTVDVAYHPNSFGNIPGGFDGVNETYYDPAKVIVPPFLPDTPECRAELAQYYQSVSRVDQGVGTLLKMLKDNGLYDNTLIIYISDNGVAFPGAKTNLYEPGMNLPCIIKPARAGKAVRGTACDSFISWVDLTPTILDCAGVEIDRPLHGRSFKTELENPQGAEPNRKIFASHTFHEITMYYPMRVLREGDYKLIYNIAHYLPYPCASDLWVCPTWQSVARKATTAEGLKNQPHIEKPAAMMEFDPLGGNELVFEDVLKSDLVYGKRKIKDYMMRPKFELYNIKNDPDEVKNLAGDPKYKDVLDRMILQIQQWQVATKDPWYLKWEYE